MTAANVMRVRLLKDYGVHLAGHVLLVARLLGVQLVVEGIAVEVELDPFDTHREDA